ncbi:pyridoxal phosphate-dependent aminotransferase [Litorimonas sp. RW-G-Af-16]|uniref:pyridoxal phosphate-dependent aminotransferase n=1 Tax=Litorimonas sp. RW-G-Af-16 TaxID=3241168 RepID=UPI00390C7AB5
MTHLSDRISRVATSATMAMTQAARDLKAQGRDIISLSAGEPDFDTPVHIRDAAKAAMDAGQTRYTAVDGIAELKAAISAKFSRDNGLTYSASQISVAPGGKPVIFNALAVLVGAGDEVIVPAPCWVSYPEMVRLCDATPIIVPCGADTDYKLTPDALAAAITPRTKWLMLNSPSNPTGAAYTSNELEALANVLRDHPQILILCDDIYEHLVYDDFKFATMAEVAPDLFERTLTMNGVSKAYAMTGWRIGYAGGPDWLIGAMRKYIGQTTSNPCSISQWAAVAALNGPQDFLNDWRTAYARRRDMMVQRLNGMKGLSCQAPPGAFYVFVDCSAVTDNDSDLAMSLLREQGVATVPGSAFHAPGHLRFSYAASDEELREACDRLEARFGRLS